MFKDRDSRSGTSERIEIVQLDGVAEKVYTWRQVDYLAIRAVFKSGLDHFGRVRRPITIQITVNDLTKDRPSGTPPGIPEKLQSILRPLG